MTSDSDDSAKPSDTPAEGRGRPQKPPLTIDLAANPPAPSGAAEEPSEPPFADPASTGSATAEAAPIVGDRAPGPPTAAEESAATGEPRPAAPEPDRASRQPPVPPRDRQQARQSGPRLIGHVVSGLIGAAVVVAIVAAIVASDIVPAPGKLAGEAAAAKADAVAATVATLETRLAAVESRPSAPVSDAEGLAKRISALEAAGKAADERIGKAEAALAAKPEAHSANMDQVLDDLMARLERVEAAVAKGGTMAPPAGLAEIEARVAALEKSAAATSQHLATLQARPPATTESEKAARALAIGSLRQAAVAGAPFAGNLAMLQALGLDETDIAALRPLAEKGAPPKAELAGAFPDVADRILAASGAVDPNAGFFDRLAGFARGLVTVRPTTPIPGDTPDAIVSRMQAAVDHGDLARALAERNALPANSKGVSAAWAQGAADRLAIDRLVEKLSRAAGAEAATAD